MNKNSRNYCFESVRLNSFKNWPLSYMDPGKLAKCGFYYTGREDYTKCFECGVEIGLWLKGDNPQSDHQRWRGNCRFVRNIPCGNVPIGVDPSTIPKPAPRGHDVCGSYGEIIMVNSVPNCGVKPKSSNILGSRDVKYKKPVYPEYVTVEARLKTFDLWPDSMTQTKERLAAAGFYYTGTGDETQCYQCGGGLKDWEPDQDPWIEHASWFTKCYHVNRVKGPSYVKSILKGGKIEVPVNNKKELPVDNNIKRSNVECDDALLCKICFMDELRIVFLPCSHLMACVLCSVQMTHCGLCREPIKSTIHAIIC